MIIYPITHYIHLHLYLDDAVAYFDIVQSETVIFVFGVEDTTAADVPAVFVVGAGDFVTA